MSRPRHFDNTFNPAAWQGFRAAQCPKEEDAFQQLIGDALKDEFFDHAFVAPTLGRDGSIDAWVDRNTLARDHFVEFSFPLIVECKQHDNNAKDLRKNITQGWESVRKKLEEKAAAGWQGNYAPWKTAQGYLYCISARFASAQEKTDLHQKIYTFFESLTEEQRPNFQREQIRVWDWNDLTHWLRTSGRVSDDWLGIDLEDLEDHGAYRRRLTQLDQSFHRYLLAEKLPFVEPDIDDLFHPEKLLKRLASCENIVLVGDGGVGKTRTVFEVAEQAHKKGWRVLHLRPSEAGVDLRALSDELLRHAGKTLVTADYIDQFRDFDARYWMHSLIPEAQQRGVQIVLLANARPLAASQILPRLTQENLFTIVEMQPTPGQRENVNRQIEAVICPQAIKTMGAAKVQALCGSRPIIAMFIARELERLINAGSSIDEALPRSGDLSGWILKRLQEDELLANVPASIWQPSASPSPILCAATVALIGSPMSREELIEVLTATLSVLATPSQIQPVTIINVLQKGGWLEEADFLLRTPHDAVADEILQSTLAHHLHVLPALFASAGKGRPLGRFATCLSRLAGQQNRHSEAILARAGQWLNDEATSLADQLLTAEPDKAAYALGAVLNCPVLDQVALAVWPQLINPWLMNYAQHPGARHLLFRGFKQLPEQAVYRLRDVSFIWLKSNVRLLEAGFVLAPLLAWSSTELGDEEFELRQKTLVWMEKYPLQTETEFVLATFLGWSAERLGEDETRLRQVSMAWLDEYPLLAETQFVLSAFLGWSAERLGEDETRLSQIGMAWLEKYPLQAETQFVLSAFLGWSAERLGEDETRLRQIGMAWLEKYLLRVETQFVLSAFLGWSAERLGEDETRLRQIGMAWLEKYPLQTETRFVLSAFLGWSEERLGEDETSLRQIGMAWLEKYPLQAETQFVLSAFLGWSEERLGEDQARLSQISMAWLEEYSLQAESQFMLSAFLGWSVERLGEDETRLRQIGMAWLEEYSLQAETGFVLATFLGWSAERLGEDETRLRQISMAWLDEYATENETDFVLTSFLDWPSERLGSLESELIRFSLAWLEKFGTSIDADFILNKVLLNPLLTGEQRYKLSGRALELVKEHEDIGDESHLLKTLLQLIFQYRGIKSENSIITFVFEWLDRHQIHPERFMVISRLLGVVWLPDRVWLALAKTGLKELETRNADKLDNFVLISIARQLWGLEKVDQTRWLQLSCRWIAEKSNRENCYQFLNIYREADIFGVPDDIMAKLNEAYSRRFNIEYEY